MLKHNEENLEKQGVKQGVKSAMAWRVSKMKPRCPNGQSSRSDITDSVLWYTTCFIDHDYHHLGVDSVLNMFCSC